MKYIVTCILSFAAMSAGPSDNAAPTLVSPTAAAAQRKRDVALDKAANEYHRAIVAADRAYSAELDEALDAAFRRKSASEIQEITNEKKRIESEIKSELALLAAEHKVNLLSLIVPEKDAVAGTWTLHEGVLIGTGGPVTRLRLRYVPPEEYDFKIEFARVSGTSSIQQIAVDNGHSVLWQVGAYDGHNCGFGLVGGQPSNVNDTHGNGPLLNVGERHTCVVAVRKNGIAAYLDDKLVSHHRSNGSDLSLPSGYDLGGPELGLATWDSSVAFYAVDVVEITGKGTFKGHN